MVVAVVVVVVDMEDAEVIEEIQEVGAEVQGDVEEVLLVHDQEVNTADVVRQGAPFVHAVLVVLTVQRTLLKDQLVLETHAVIVVPGLDPDQRVDPDHLRSKKMAEAIDVMNVR